MALLSDDPQTRLAIATAGLHATLTALASDVVARIDERCPYRACEGHCTFAYGCVNQRRVRSQRDGAMCCAGDHQLRRADE